MERIILGNEVTNLKKLNFFFGKEKFLFKKLEKIMKPLEEEMIFFQGLIVGMPALAQGRFQEMKVWGVTPRAWLSLETPLTYLFDSEGLQIVEENRKYGFPLNYENGKLARLVDCRGRILFENEEEVNSWVTEFEERLNKPSKESESYVHLPGLFALMRSYGCDYAKDLIIARKKEKERKD